VFDIVTPDQNETASRVEGGGIHDRNARLARTAAKRTCGCDAPQDPYEDRDQRQHDYDGDEETDSAGPARFHMEGVDQPTCHAQRPFSS
jgi:hypothetical protein